MKFSGLILANLFRKKIRLILTIGSFAVALFLFAFLAVVQGAFSRGADVAGVVAFQLFDPRQCLLQSAEGEQAFPNGVVALEARGLGQHGFATGQVADAAVTEPATVRLHVHALGNHKLGSGRLDECPIRPGVAGNHFRVHEGPAVGRKQHSVLLVCRVNVESQPKRPAAQARHLGELTKFMDAKTVGFASIFDGTVGAAPACNACELS